MPITSAGKLRASTIDLLHNSFVEVCDGCDEVKSQAEAFSAVSVSAAQDAKAFEGSQNVFNADPARSQVMILLFLLRGERMKLAFLVRCFAIGVEFVHTLIAGIAQQFKARRQSQTAVLVKGEVVGFARTHGHANNFLLSVFNHDLPFLGMAFFLAGVEATLFFWGRSMRCSLASTTSTVNSKEPLCKAFLPGR